MKGVELKIKVKYLVPDIDEIEPISQGDWIDLRCAEDTYLKRGEFRYIPLGVCVELPQYYEALVAPRSSLFKHYGIIMTNSIGVIDNSYCGDNDQWHFPAYATRDTFIKKNERICQFRIIQNQPFFDIVKVDHLGNEDRNGLGSTGRK